MYVRSSENRSHGCPLGAKLRSSSPQSRKARALDSYFLTLLGLYVGISGLLLPAFAAGRALGLAL